MSWLQLSDRLTRAGLIILWINTGVFLIFGLLATFSGGEWAHFGEGLGGGWGIPALIFEIPLLLSLPSLFIGINGMFKRESAKALRLLAFAGPLLISIAFILIAHGVDPCASHHWTLLDFIGDQRLCERFGADISIHTRYHLLLHIAPIVAILAIYHIALSRFNLKT